MARLSRAEIFDPSEIVAVHMMGRTVRRCHLLLDMDLRPVASQVLKIAG
jgi:hypothetical protein